MKSQKFILLLLIFVALFIVIKFIKTTPSDQSSIQEIQEVDQLEVRNWESYEFPEVGLSLSAPFEMSVTGEKLDERTFTLYVQRQEYSEGMEYYQLYGLYNLSTDTVNVEDLKSGFNEDSIEELNIDGYTAISGQNKGERNRFVTYIITDKGLFMLATSQPTIENKLLTDEILSTMQID
jgi:hypothetical protein